MPASSSTAWRTASTWSCAVPVPHGSRTRSSPTIRCNASEEHGQPTRIFQGNSIADRGSVRAHRPRAEAGGLRHLREQLFQRARRPQDQGRAYPHRRTSDRRFRYAAAGRHAGDLAGQRGGQIQPSGGRQSKPIDKTFRGWGRACSDFATGVYAFDTIKPGVVAGRNKRPMAPHVNFWIVARGINIGLSTRMYFSDEAAANAKDPVLNIIEWETRRSTLDRQSERRRKGRSYTGSTSICRGRTKRCSSTSDRDRSSGGAPQRNRRTPLARDFGWGAARVPEGRFGACSCQQCNSLTDMPVDFDVAPELRELQERIRSFVAEQVIPMEGDARCTAHGPTDALRRELIAKARQAAPAVPSRVARVRRSGADALRSGDCFRRGGLFAARSRCAQRLCAGRRQHAFARSRREARTQGALVAAACGGQIRSCFCMTEPAPGAGSDPSMLTTTARRDQD